MKVAVIILSIALAICMFLGYFSYEHLSRELNTASQQRHDYETMNNYILSRYIEVLDAVERRQTNVEDIVHHYEDLDVAIEKIRTYNASALTKRSRKRTLAVGGAE